MTTSPIKISKSLKLKLITLTIFILICFGKNIFAQTQDKVYAGYLLNFARKIQWPSGPHANNLVIGVLDSPSLASELKYATRIKTNHKIQIKEYASSSEVGFCHILFVPGSKARSLSDIVKKLPDTPTLIVSELEGLAAKACGINFLRVDGKLKFELNNDEVERRGLKIPTDLKLLSLKSKRARI